MRSERGTTADARRWWMVGCEGSVPHFYAAPSGRSAVAEFRSNLMTMERSCSGVSLRDARTIVRGLAPHVLEGPLTTQQVYELDRGWSWAIAVCDRYDGVIPTSPCSRETAVHHLGEERTLRLERSAQQRYGLDREAVRAA